MESPKFYCNDCKTSYARKYLLTQHLTSTKHLNRTELSPTSSLFSCDCGKSYIQKKSLEYHKKNCNKLMPTTTTTHIIPPTTTIAQNATEILLETFEKEREEMKSQIAMLLDKHAGTIIDDSNNNPIIDTIIENKPPPLQQSITIIEIMKQEMNKMKEEIIKLKKDFIREKQKTRQEEVVREEGVHHRKEPAPKKSRDKRKKIKMELRKQIVDNQKNTCGKCKQVLSAYFQIDHIVGLQFGGTDDESNLMALCCECHVIKSIEENKRRKQIQEAIQAILSS